MLNISLFDNDDHIPESIKIQSVDPESKKIPSIAEPSQVRWYQQSRDR